MAQVKRNDIEYYRAPSAENAGVDYRYDAGGPIAQLQADLASRLATEGMGQAVPADASAERLVHLLSAGGGYLALLMGYGLVGLAVAHFI